MDNIIQELTLYFSYPFVVYAFIVGVLMALCSSLIGTSLVLKRLSFIGDGLSHIAFGAIAVASALKLTNNTVLVFPVTALASLLLLRSGENKKIHGDAAIAMMSVGSLAIGYMILNIFPSSSNIAADVCTALFGSTSILTLTPLDVGISLFLSSFVILIFGLFYYKIFAVTFDESFAKATGIPTKFYNPLLAITISAVIVVAMNLVGSLLISALVVFPSLSSMQLFGSYKNVVWSSVIIAILCAVLGMLSSILYGTPVGATIVVANIGVFCTAYILARIIRK